MPGPAPKPSSRRSRKGRDGGVRTLVPASDLCVVVPEFPLGANVGLSAQIEVARDLVARLQVDVDEVTDRRRRYSLNRKLEKTQLELAMLELQAEQVADLERSIWQGLWSTPQAQVWQDNPGCWRELGLYVRWMVAAEQGDTRAGTQARALSDSLGINPAALLRLRLEIEHVDEVVARGNARRQRASVPTGQVVDDPRAGLF